LTNSHDFLQGKLGISASRSGFAASGHCDIVRPHELCSHTSSTDIEVKQTSLRGVTLPLWVVA
jgi:hypothetical protein